MPDIPRRLVWAPAAERDLRDVWRYYARVASPELPDKLLREIYSAVERVIGRAFSGRPRDDVMLGLRSILVPPHIVFFRISKDVVEIVRVLHQHRDFATVFPRKPEAS
jgi:toxin ParE1/3/4